GDSQTARQVLMPNAGDTQRARRANARATRPPSRRERARCALSSYLEPAWIEQATMASCTSATAQLYVAAAITSRPLQSSHAQARPLQSRCPQVDRLASESRIVWSVRRCALVA